MNKNNFIISSAIIAVGIFFSGFAISRGIKDFADKDRVVTVKGLSEKTVKADKVTWPIVYKEVGNDLTDLYQRIDKKTNVIKKFLKENGVTEKEINVNPPKVFDLTAERYASNEKNYRYNISSTITIISNEVDKIREIIAKQGDLLKEDVAIINGGYEDPIYYEYTSFNIDKSSMMAEAISNAENTARQFAENSHSKIDKIMNASQGQFSIDSESSTTPYIMKIRVVTTITYSLKD